MTHGGGGGGVSGRGDRGWCCSYSTRAAISTVSHQGTGRRENRAESLRRSPADRRGPTSLCRRRWNHLCCCVPLSEGPTLRPLTRKRGREHGLFFSPLSAFLKELGERVKPHDATGVTNRKQLIHPQLTCSPEREGGRVITQGHFSLSLGFFGFE